MSRCTWTFAVDTITFEGVGGSKQNLVGVFYVWNVGRVLKFKVKSWSWSWSWSWTEFLFSQKLCGGTPNLVGIFSIWRITFSNALLSEILILVMILILKKKKFWKSRCLSMYLHLHRQNGLYVSVSWKIWYTASGRNWTFVTCDV